MAPKPKKKKKNKKSKDKNKDRDDGMPGLTEEDILLRKELQHQANMLSKQANKEDHDFNEFQQQRERLNYFWIVEKKKLEDKKAELRNKERELQDLEEKHQVEIKIYKQRVKHLLFEHQNEITQNKTEAEVALKLAQDDNRLGEAELKVDKRRLNLEIKEQELSHQDHLKSLKQSQDKNITELRQEFERKAQEVQKNYEEKMKVVRQRLEKQRADETRRIEEDKKAHIDLLMQEHEKAFAEIKNYYNDITHNNLDLIKSLKEETNEMRKKDLQDEKKMMEVAQENKRMSEPLKKAEQDVKRLTDERNEYQTEKEELKMTKSRLLVVEDKLRNLRWENEILAQKFGLVKKERDDLYERYRTSVFKVQQRTGFRNLLLEKKLEALEDQMQQREAHLNEVLSRANLEPTVIGQVRGKLDDILEKKNQVARDLQAELDRMQAAHQHLQQAVRHKLTEFGVPVEELGFQPIRTETLRATDKMVMQAMGQTGQLQH
mmetsp:Transcript_2804/g.4002  ORF Transcript_2804/g.4002 Transcript_2804/m.4002 type:complete len:490 (+) Transcript_2804:51-1520(+)|eukprot:CAMPEP_0117755034 /NCGR_PEP_ID=MMETSP0947-20121206/13203_1 /TAXON_ID=44440 /ORGANISM="Chattonella subsalsa, Strain CCMP2191" /LENGTH=489 /DNA_ID=CAMNT_0005574275 /DNA_START=29 /DNA_END=1498 /DNA_ORIENTATION=-